MKKIVFLILTALMVVAMLAVACAAPAPAPAPTPSPTPTPEPTPGVINIGVASPLTGPPAFLGGEVTNAIIMALEEQNTKGGVTIAGKKYTFNPIKVDTKADAAVGATVGEQLIFDNKVKAIFGPFQADAIGMQNVTEANKIPTWFIQCLTPDMTGPNKPYSFFTSFPIPQMTYKQLYYIKGKYPQAKNVLTVSVDVPDAIAFQMATEATCKLLGFNWIGAEKFGIETRDFAPFISRVLARKPDIIDTSQIGGVMGGLHCVLLKQLREAGFNGVIFIPAAPPEEAMQQTVPQKYLNDVVTHYVDLNGPVVVQKYRDVMVMYKEKYDQEAVDVVPAYYNVLDGFFKFLNSQDSLDPTAWMEGFSKYRWDGVMGTESFWVEQVGDGINRRVFQNNWVTHYENGKPITDFEAPVPWEMFVKPSWMK